jgi:hypothetical protein
MVGWAELTNKEPRRRPRTRRLAWRVTAYAMAGVVAAVVLPTTAVAAKRSPRVGRVVAQSAKVQINGYLEDGELTGAFRLRAAVASVPASAYYFFMGDLRGVSGTTGSVGRQHVKLPDPVDLPAGGRRHFTVAVTGLTRPGVYAGSLQVIRIAAPRRPAATLTLEVKAMRRPAPRVIGSTPVKLTAVKPIVPSLDTAVSPLFGYSEQVAVQLDNPVTAQLPVQDGTADLRRDFDGHPVAVRLGPDEQRSLSQWNAATDRTLVVSVRPTREAPGRYRGEILIGLADVDTRFAVPTELDIKYGPLLPLGVLILSLVLGIALRHLVSWFSATRRTDKSRTALSRRINGIEREVEGLAAAATGLPDPQDPTADDEVEVLQDHEEPKGDAQSEARRVAEQLVAQLAGARRLVAAGDFAEATKTCDSVTEMVGTVHRMRDAWDDFRRVAEPKLDEPARAEAKRLTAEALWQWSDGKVPAANGTLDRLEARRWAWERDPSLVGPAPQPMRPTVTYDELQLRQFHLLQAGPMGLLGVVRPLFAGAATSVFYLGLVVVLAIAAMELFYFNNDTFGARLIDWFPLVGWGLATDPVSNALTRLRANPAGA